MKIKIVIEDGEKPTLNIQQIIDDGEFAYMDKSHLIKGIIQRMSYKIYELLEEKHFGTKHK